MTTQALNRPVDVLAVMDRACDMLDCGEFEVDREAGRDLAVVRGLIADLIAKSAANANLQHVVVDRYPFVRCKATVFDGEGLAEVDSWRPGVEFETRGHQDDEPEAVADGLGKMVLTEVSRHKPGKYPERVFYVRQFTTPDGVTFGKTNLRIATATQFRRMCAGYRHAFRMREILVLEDAA